MELKIFCDGGARGNPGPAAWAFIVYGEGNRLLAQNNGKMGIATNNVAEYTAVIKALEWLGDYHHAENGKVRFFLDSQLVVSQLNGIFKIKNHRLRELIIRVREKEQAAGGNISYEYIPRKKNFLADKLVNAAFTPPPVLR